MIRFEMKNYKISEAKYQHYQLEKLINMNILQVKKYCFLMKDK